ncbi:glycosyltransferase [Acidithiobacillus montserratensis]|uniref:glycosyltransferase n=1 Tax=Acidithiobacillus montserratensis TaxID=2729135 RepID=UPI003C6F53EB
MAGLTATSLQWLLDILVGGVLLAWLVLFFGRGYFWRADQRLPALPPASLADKQASPACLPAVVAIVPARNEAEGIGPCVSALLGQHYPGTLRVMLVDDQSTDGTADIAQAAAESISAAGRLQILAGKALPEGWAGKVWAMHQGVAAAGDAPLLWFTDADIVHGPDVLEKLVLHQQRDNRALVSLMVMLSCRSFWERLLIPPFIFFFQMLYPFPWVNDRRRPLAGAAGGCMLLRRDLLLQAGGFAAMRGALIDDCTLAALMKKQGPIWLGLGTESHSLRDYRFLDEIWRMVTRSAYVQLQFSPWRLLEATLGMIFLYALPVVMLVAGLVLPQWLWIAPSGLALGLMAWAYAPSVRLYALNGLWVLTLPVAAMLYTLMTLDSARRHYLGRGGAWKGRHYDQSGEKRP